MSDVHVGKNLSDEVREIRRNPIYSKELSNRLIGLLKDSNCAISDLAGRGLEVLGEPAFEDLLAAVTAPAASPWPDAVWVLGSLSLPSDRLLPYLRTWLANSSGPLEDQCALTLSALLLAQKQFGKTVDPNDLAACLNVMERNALDGAAGKLHLRLFRERWDAATVSG